MLSGSPTLMVLHQIFVTKFWKIALKMKCKMGASGTEDGRGALKHADVTCKAW